jgi:hypothetical protein
MYRLPPHGRFPVRGKLVMPPKGVPIDTAMYSARWRGMINFETAKLTDLARFGRASGMRFKAVLQLKQNYKKAKKLPLPPTSKFKNKEALQKHAEIQAFDWAVRDAMFLEIENEYPNAQIKIMGTAADTPDFGHHWLVGKIFKPNEAFDRENLRRYGCQHQFMIVSYGDE